MSPCVAVHSTHLWEVAAVLPAPTACSYVQITKSGVVDSDLILSKPQQAVPFWLPTSENTHPGNAPPPTPAHHLFLPPLIPLLAVWTRRLFAGLPHLHPSLPASTSLTSRNQSVTMTAASNLSVRLPIPISTLNSTQLNALVLTLAFFPCSSYTFSPPTSPSKTTPSTNTWCQLTASRPAAGRTAADCMLALHPAA